MTVSGLCLMTTLIVLPSSLRLLRPRFQTPAKTHAMDLTGPIINPESAYVVEDSRHLQHGAMDLIVSHAQRNANELTWGGPAAQWEDMQDRSGQACRCSRHEVETSVSAVTPDPPRTCSERSTVR